MAMTFYEIPTTGNAQKFVITLNGVEYNISLVFRDHAMGGWIMDIADAQNVQLACGLPLVTGCNIIEQFAYLGIGGALLVSTDGDFFANPTFDNLGSSSHLWFGVRT